VARSASGDPHGAARAAASNTQVGSARRRDRALGGTADDYEAIFGFFDSPLLFTDDQRALALSHNRHRHTFELTQVAGRKTSGVMKDVVMLGGYQEMEIDFLANNPGLSLFHCHQQLHMDFGFMALFDYV
jgi:Multicopper oxidase